MKKSLLLFVCCLFSISMLQAAAISWDGGASTNNWSDANNWSPNGVPGLSDDVTINIAATVSLASLTTTIKSLFINHASATLTIASDGSLTISGAIDGVTIQNGTLTNNGDLNITSMSNEGMFLGISSSTLVVFNNNSGATLDLTSITDMGILTEYSNTTVNNSGTITLTAPGNDGMRINRESTVNNFAGGIINITDGVDVGIACDRAGRVNNTGTINVTNGIRHGIELFVRSSAPVDLSRLDNLTGGVINITSTNLSGVVDGNGFRISTNGIVNNDGTINSYDNAGPDISLQSSTLTFSNTSNATFAPGASPGTYTVSGGDFSLGSSTYSCEINGTTASTQYDVMDFSGTVTIVNGSSKLNLVFGFNPAVNDVFDIVTAGTVTGTFASGNITFSGGNVTAVNVTYPAGKVKVTVSALPVELVSFDARLQEKTILLTWQTASELINEGFEIQRVVGDAALEAGRWQVLAFVEGHGTTNEVQNYSYTDEHARAGLNYYRLKQIDLDGKFEYSDVVSVQFAVGSPELEVFPNPVGADELTLHLPESNGDKAIIRLYDQTSRLVLQKTTSSQKQTLNVSQLPAGIYFVEVTVGEKVFKEKVVVE